MNEMALRIDFTQRDSAAGNMRYDEELLALHKEGSPVLRWYEWESPGITVSHRQSTAPSELGHLDISSRVTGGGILFHSPGDLVFSFVGSLTDFGNGLKPKLLAISAAATQALIEVGFPATRICQAQGQENREFCHTYFSPYEVVVEGEKIVAITLRRFRTQFIIQGIFHINSNIRYFSLPSDWNSFLSKGLPTGILAPELGVVFQKHLSQSLFQR